MALSLIPPNSSCLYARTTTTSRSRLADWPGCLRTGKRNVNTSFYKEAQKELSRRSKGTATRAQTTMMCGVSRVFYHNKAEGTSAFVSLWDTLISSSLAVYDTMQNLKSSVHTWCIGSAYDIAGFILASGKKGNRDSLPHSRVILRSPVGEANGQADVVLNETKELIKIRDRLYNELAEHTGQPVEKIFHDLTDCKSFNSQQAIEYGLIDHITRSLFDTIG